MSTTYDFTQQETRKNFIEVMPSGIYSAMQEENGQYTLIFLNQNEGMTVKNLNSKGWYECIDYDCDGYMECDYLEKAHK